VRRISPTSCRVARRGTFREINRQVALSLIRSKQPVSRAELARLTIEQIMARARAGETQALETLRETGHFLALGFATIVKSVGPVRIYVGGEVPTVWDLLSGTVRDTLRGDAIVREAGETEILTVPLGEHPRLRGAAALIGTPAFAAPVVS